MMVLLQVILLLVLCSSGWGGADPIRDPQDPNFKDFVQDSGQTPDAFTPGGVGSQMDKKPIPKQVQLPRIEVADEKTGTLKGGEGVTFTLKGITFEGNEAIPTEELNHAVDNYVGQTIEVNKLQDIADRVTSYYIENGYILTRAYLPPQTIESGRVLIRVREGKLGKIIVKGNERYKKEIIENVIMVMKKKGAVKTTDLERALLLLMDYPGLEVKATLTAGEDPGTTDIIVAVTEQRLVGAGLDYNNYGSKYVAEHRVGGNVSLYNITGLGDALNANVNVGLSSGDLFYGRLEYNFPVYYWGTRIGLVASRLAFEGGKELEVLELEGDTGTWGAWISHPFIRTRNVSLWADAGLDYKDSQSETLFYTQEDKLMIGRAGATLDWLDKFRGRNIVSAKISQGLNKEDLELRWDSDTQFTKAEVRANRFTQHSHDINTVLSLGAQYSPDRVPSAEMLSLGGANTVRGYDQSEISGDTGLYGTFELRVPVWQDEALDWTLLNARGAVLQVAAFMDYGTVKKNDADVSEIVDGDMFGAGLGLRFALSPWVQAKVDYARSLGGDDPVDDEGKWYLQLSTFY